MYVYKYSMNMPWVSAIKNTCGIVFNISQTVLIVLFALRGEANLSKFLQRKVKKLLNNCKFILRINWDPISQNNYFLVSVFFE